MRDVLERMVSTKASFGPLTVFSTSGADGPRLTPVLISKAIGGSQPLAVVVYNKNLDKWTAGAHAGTFRGNQLAMKAGTIVLNRVSKKEFLDDVVRKGDLIRTKLEELKQKVSIIGDVRGKGLMIGTEFVNPKAEKDCIGSLPSSGEIAAKVQNLC